MSEQCSRVGITRRKYLFLSQFLHGEIFGFFLRRTPIFRNSETSVPTRGDMSCRHRDGWNQELVRG